MSVLAALVAGTLGLLAGLALERFRRSGTDRRWLLDHRHEALITFLTAADSLFRAAFAVSQHHPGSMVELNERMQSISHAYFGAALTCPEGAKELVDGLYSLLSEVSEETDTGRLHTAKVAYTGRVAEILKLARAELQPAGAGWRQRVPRPSWRRA